MRRLKRVTAILSVGFLLVGITQPAFAATDKYKFTADFKYRLTSGGFHSAKGTNTFYFSCTSGNKEAYAVQIWREKVLGDTKVDTLKLTCNTSKAQSDTWTAPASDDYHFVLTKLGDDVYIVGSGYDQYQK